MKRTQTHTQETHFTHELTVTYDGIAHVVHSFEEAWTMAWEHIPATIYDPSA
jgi:hypothetical protein